MSLNKAGYGRDRKKLKKKDGNVRYKCHSCGNIINQMEVRKNMHFISGISGFNTLRTNIEIDMMESDIVVKCINCGATITTSEEVYANITDMISLPAGETAEVDIIA